MKIKNIKIQSFESLISPYEVEKKLPLNDELKSFIALSRQNISNILNRKDKRFIIITGPCSIHDDKSALDYAQRLKKLQQKYSENLLIVMRVYFEKPRTTVGWKGYINDPHMDDSFHIQTGLLNARRLLIEINKIGLPIATEALDPISPQYLGDLFSWAAIGARTVESQTHREIASGLSVPVGFKNGTKGSLDVAINGMCSALEKHRFLGIDTDGKVSIVSTTGNDDVHLILRGGKEPNYDSVHVSIAEQRLKEAKLRPNIIIDCSHSNSLKKPELQPLVADNVIKQVIEGNQSIVGIMLESHIHSGNQSIPDDLSKLKYGVSVTDGCIDWETTCELVASIDSQLANLKSSN